MFLINFKGDLSDQASAQLPTCFAALPAPVLVWGINAAFDVCSAFAVLCFQGAGKKLQASGRSGPEDSAQPQM